MPLPDQDPYCEIEILHRVSEGNEKAFTQLFIQHHQHLAAYVDKLTGSRELAEEVVLDVFLKIWTSRQSLREITNFRSWLYVVSRNHTFNCLRRIVKEKLEKEAWLNNQSAVEHETALGNTDIYAKAIEAIGQLPPQQQKVFVLRRLKNMKYKDIASHLNVSRETVKSYIKLAYSSVSMFARGRRSTLESRILMILALHF